NDVEANTASFALRDAASRGCGRRFPSVRLFRHEEEIRHATTKVRHGAIARQFLILFENLGTSISTVDCDSPILWINEPNENDAPIEELGDPAIDLTHAIVGRLNFDGQGRNI